MLHNYLLIAWRNLKRHKVFSLVNLLGLAIGLAACLLMAIFVVDELSFDRHLPHAEQIYRVLTESRSGNGVDQSLHVHEAIGQALRHEFPEVIAATRFGYYTDQFRAGSQFLPVRVAALDPEGLKVFNFSFRSGNPQTALNAPNSMVISERMAEMFFPGRNPIGQLLEQRAGQEKPVHYRITGVMHNLSSRSHFHAEALISRRPDEEPLAFRWNGYSLAPLYIRLADHTKAGELKGKLNAFYRKYDFYKDLHLCFQPITRIHLHSNLENELEANSDIRYVYIFSVTAFFILLIACINFVNLSTARSLKRAREIGVRKVLGARRSQLIRQLLGESFLYFILALGIGLTLVQASLPWFGSIIGRELSMRVLATPTIALLLGGLGGIVCLLTCAYPALYLSRQQAIFVLKGVLQASTLNAWMRKGLVTLQFSASLTLMIATAIVYSQLHYIRTKRLGFTKEQLIVLPLASASNGPAFKQEIWQLPGVISVSQADWHPGRRIGSQASMEDPKKPGEALSFYFVSADSDYVKTLQIELTAGKDFDPAMGTSLEKNDSATHQPVPELPTEQPILINETTVRKLGLKDPVGQILDLPALQGRVVGVTADFNGRSLHHQVPPIVIRGTPPSVAGFTLVRIRAENIRATLDGLRRKWQEFYPADPFGYTFLDESLEKLYQSEQRVGKLFGFFASLGIGIACLGLFALAAFAAEQRTKEIGIRKVLGASEMAIMGLISKDFLLLVLLANGVAWPLAGWTMHRWLQDFAYRIELHPGLFILPTLLTLLVALLTVSTQTWKAARANPVRALRYE